MNEADKQRARQAAINATSRAEYQEESGDWAIAAGFYTNAAALWRIAGDELKGAEMDKKAAEMIKRIK